MQTLTHNFRQLGEHSKFSKTSCLTKPKTNSADPDQTASEEAV